MHAEWATFQLTQAVEFAGPGIHTGEIGRVLVCPPKVPGGGCWMERQGQRWPVTVESVLEVERCTVLGQGSIRVSTVEHLLSALSALNIYHCDLRVEGAEIPILDGSALPFVEGLRGCLEPGPPVQPLHLSQPIWVGNENSQVLALPCPVRRFQCSLYYPHPQLGYQEVTFEPEHESFSEVLAPARTFALEQEVAWLRQRGLARGGSLDNALVVMERGFSSPLRLTMEPARHKCLDLVGDLYLLGRPLLAQVLAIKAGHRWHVELVRKLQREVVGHAG